ncbi:WD40-repeat-containing domain protein [Haematococcus lacustris]
MGQSEDWDAFVLSYLHAKGHKDAEAAFLRSARIDGNDMALTDRLSIQKGVAEQLVASFQLEADPLSTVDAYSRLAKWVDGSLDMHRAELSGILYPVFIHCYMVLVGKDAAAQAAELYDRHSPSLLHMAGSASRSRARELQELRGIAVKQHLATSQLAKQISSARHTLQLSSYANDLLMHFLHSSPQMLQIASIVNQYITIQVVSGLVRGEAAGPGSEQEGEEGAEGAPQLGLSLLDAGVLHTNQTPINLNLLKGTPEDLLADQEEQRQLDAAAALEAAAGAEQAAAGPAAATADPAVNPPNASEAGPLSQAAGATAAAGAAAGTDASTAPAAAAAAASGRSRKDKKAEAKAAAAAAVAAAKAKREARAARIDPPSWMGVLSEAVQTAWLRDVEARATVSPARLPSCCFFTFANTRQSMTATTFLPDVRKVAAGFADSSVRLYNVAQLAASTSTSGAVRAKSNGASEEARGSLAEDAEDDEAAPSGISYLYGHTGPVHSLDFTHDARMLLSASTDGSVRLWSSELGTGLTVFRGHMLPVWDVAASPWGYHWASASADRTARVWATDNLRTLRVMAGHQADVDLVRWHPNCHYLATASSDCSVRLWDVATGACVRIMTGLHTPPTSLAISPDGKLACAGAQDGSIVTWDLGNARRMSTLTGHVGPVWSLAFSLSDGSVLASGGADETVKLWSVAVTGNDGTTAPAGKPGLLHSYNTKSSSVTHVQYSRRNLLLAAGSIVRKPG